MPCNSKGAKARSKHRMKWKDSNSEVTKPCHLGARRRLQHLAFVHKILKSMLSSMSQHASVFSHWSRLYYAPYAHDQGLFCTACAHLSGGSRGGSMGSMEPLFWRAAFENIMRKRTHTGATHFSFKVAITHDLNSIISCIDARMTYVHVYTTRSIETMSEARERIKAKVFLFMQCTLSS